jgi:hypothetical protein
VPNRNEARVAIVRDRPHERTEMVRVRLSLTEKLELSQRADAENIPIPAYLRKRGLAEDHSKELAEALKAMRGIYEFLTEEKACICGSNDMGGHSVTCRTVRKTAEQADAAIAQYQDKAREQ